MRAKPPVIPGRQQTEQPVDTRVRSFTASPASCSSPSCSTRFLVAALTGDRPSERRSAPQFQLNLASSSASNFKISDRSASVCRCARKLRYRPIFSRLTNYPLHPCSLQRLADTKIRCALLAAAASSMSGSGHFTRLRPKRRAANECWVRSARYERMCLHR